MEQNQTVPPATTQSDIASITLLVRRGLLPNKDLPGLKVAMTRLKRVGDIAKLPRTHRDVLQRYNDAMNKAAIGSRASTMAVARNLQKEELQLELTEQLSDPPMMMVLKRKGIRIFPDGKRVALYVNEKLGLTFTIPYTPAAGKTENPMTGVNEELEDIMETIEQVTKYAQEETPKNPEKHFKFADGSKLKVSHGHAKAIHMVHGALNDQNKKHFETMLTDPKQFTKAANWALSKVKFSINK
jgi:hypothetical protein